MNTHVAFTLAHLLSTLDPTFFVVDLVPSPTPFRSLHSHAYTQTHTKFFGTMKLSYFVTPTYFSVYLFPNNGIFSYINTLKFLTSVN